MKKKTITNKDRKAMRKCIEQFESNNFVAPPPWVRAKSKQDAFRWGQAEGELTMRRQYDSEEKQKHAQESANERAIKLRALQDICQAGSTIIEGMSKALLSLNNHL